MAGRNRVPLEIRYERHIRRGASPDDCWIWHGSGNKAGYGQMRVGRTGNGPVVSVHRWAYEHFVGPIPEGKWVCHHCDEPRCSNPKHLYAGDPWENMRDCVERGRRAAKHAFGGRLNKLTDDQVRAIRVDERSPVVVGLAHGVSELTVRAVRRRKRKAHVADEPVVTAEEAEARWPLVRRGSGLGVVLKPRAARRVRKKPR